jgi:hypothetical protein
LDNSTHDSRLASDARNIIFRFGGELDSDTNCFHLNYESEQYRQDALVGLIQDAIPSFALTHDEYTKYLQERAISDLNRNSINRVSTAHKNAKGDYGELLLFLILEAFESAPKFVTKVKLRSTKKDQIKGYDCAHFTIDKDDNVTLWLGEAKFHSSIYGAVDDAIESLSDHMQDGYIRNELDILHDNIEINNLIEQRYYDILEPYLGRSKSLDEVRINVPVLLTYDSKAIKGAKSHLDEGFIESLGKEIATYSKSQLRGKVWPEHASVSISFYLFPLESVAYIKQKLSEVESALR